MDNNFDIFSKGNIDLLIRFAVSLGIGLLIGLEREFAGREQATNEKRKHFAGVRTFPLFAVFGFLAGLLAREFSPYVFVVSIVCVVALIIASYLIVARKGGIGGTTELSILVTFLLGTLVFAGYILLAILIAVVMVLLLSLKLKIHSFVQELSIKGIRAIIQFVIITALILPFLPNKNFGPFNAWNLKEIWTMVVLVSGISFTGYLFSKIFKSSDGTIFTGIAGGFASSTAVTLSYSQRSKSIPFGDATKFAIGIIAAGTIMFPRIIFEVYILNIQLLKHLWLPLSVLTIVGLGVAVFMYRRSILVQKEESMEIENPLNLSMAIKFGFLYAIILLVVKYVNAQFGSTGLYLASMVSGVTDVDAITISMAKLAQEPKNLPIAINSILIAVLSNTAVKLLIVLVIGSTDLKKKVALGLGAILLTGLSCFILNFYK